LRGAHEARQATALARPQTPCGSAVSVHRLRTCRHGRVARGRRGSVKRPRTRRVRKGGARLTKRPRGGVASLGRSDTARYQRLSDPRVPGNSMRDSRRLSKEVGSAKSPASLPIFSRLPSSVPLRRGLRIRNCFRQTGRSARESECSPNRPSSFH
jgi:hypothetical protein